MKRCFYWFDWYICRNDSSSDGDSGFFIVCNVRQIHCWVHGAAMAEWGPEHCNFCFHECNQMADCSSSQQWVFWWWSLYCNDANLILSLLARLEFAPSLNRNTQNGNCPFFHCCGKIPVFLSGFLLMMKKPGQGSSSYCVHHLLMIRLTWKQRKRESATNFSIGFSF